MVILMFLSTEIGSEPPNAEIPAQNALFPHQVTPCRQDVKAQAAMVVSSRSPSRGHGREFKVTREREEILNFLTGGPGATCVAL